jgi:hypothetical protein
MKNGEWANEQGAGSTEPGPRGRLGARGAAEKLHPAERDKHQTSRRGCRRIGKPKVQAGTLAGNADAGAVHVWCAWVRPRVRPGPTRSDQKNMNMTRNGKIGRLPKAVKGVRGKSRNEESRRQKS